MPGYHVSSAGAPPGETEMGPARSARRSKVVPQEKNVEGLRVHPHLFTSVCIRDDAVGCVRIAIPAVPGCDAIRNERCAPLGCDSGVSVQLECTRTETREVH